MGFDANCTVQTILAQYLILHVGNLLLSTQYGLVVYSRASVRVSKYNLLLFMTITGSPGSMPQQITSSCGLAIAIVVTLCFNYYAGHGLSVAASTEDWPVSYL